MKALSISNWRVQFAFAFTILTLLIVGAISYRELTLSIESNRWARHTHEVIESIHDLSLDWASISSDSRSFVLTGEDSYFESYRAEAAKALEDAEVIRRLTVDNPKQQARISILKPLTAERIEQAEQITSLRRTQGLTAAVAEMQRKPDEQQAVQFNVVTQELQSEELRLLALRDATTKLRLNLMKAGLIFAALLILLIAMAAGWGAVRESSALGLAEVSLRESDEKYRILVDGVEDYAIFMLDPDGTIISWNAGAERIKGYRAEEIIGRNFSCFFTQEDIKRGSPEDILRLAVATGKHEETCIRVRKDGSRFSSIFTITTLRDIAGNLRGFSEISRDLSKHMQSEVKYRGLLEAAPDAMVVVDRNEKIVLLNVQAEKQFGYKRDELVGQSVTRIIPEGFAERLIADGTRTEAEASSQRIGMGIELTARRKDGSEFPIEIMLSPLESADGVLVTAAIRDISLRKESEAKYRGLLEAAPDAMVVVDQQGEIVLLNLQAERQFGYSRDELLGQKVTSIIPEGFAERLIADETRTAADASAQQIGTGIELYGLRKDHTGFPMEIMLSPLESAEGTLITAAIRDISVRKESEARYRGLLEAAPDAMVVVNANGEIVLLNVQAEKRFGYSRDELLGRKVTSIIPEGFAERLIADGTRTAAEAFAQQIGTGIELYGLRKDRTEFPMEIMLSPLDSADGVLVTAAIRDISLRKESEAKYRGLLEAAPDAMVVVDQQGEIVLLNLQAERQFGYRRDELVGQKVTSIIPEGFAERLIADGTRTAAEAFAQQIGTGIELYGLRKDHTGFPMEIMLSPLETIGGTLVTAAIRDISVRKKAEADLLQNVKELHRSNEELEQFAYIASHDLQEPLRMVASYTQLIARRYKGKLDSDADEFIAFAVDGASRMQRLIMDLLTYSRVGTKETVLRDISGDEALRQALFNLRGAIEESGAQVTCDPLPVVSADETQLVQLFQNLIGNAIKYQNGGSPTVHVSATRNGIAKWSFSVKDNGLGIEPQYFERVFGMFQRLHKREEFTGTGIGLAICKKIVERHGGSISVESQLGQGSTFCFVLKGSEKRL